MLLHGAQPDRLELLGQLLVLLSVVTQQALLAPLVADCLEDSSDSTYFLGKCNN